MEADAALVGILEHLVSLRPQLEVLRSNVKVHADPACSCQLATEPLFDRIVEHGVGVFGDPPGIIAISYLFLDEEYV